MLRLLAVLLACTALIASASAQTGPSSSRSTPSTSAADLTTGTNEFGVWAAYSPNSPQNIGVSPDRQLFLLNGFYARVIGTTNGVAIKYTVDIVPVALISQPAETQFTAAGTPVFRPKQTIYGGGLDPIGLQFNFRRSHKIQPYADLHGGFLYFTKQVPVVNSSQYNFTVSFGGGVQVFSGERTSFSLGYNYYHLSNGYTGNVNPGVDGNLFFAAFSFFK